MADRETERGRAADEAAPTRNDDHVLMSVVIACVNGPPSILECLEHLVRQETDAPYEVLVVDRCGDDTRREIRERFPQSNVHVIAEAPMTSIPRLRAIGVARARGRLVGILEDHCMVPPGWVETARELHDAGHRVMGGPVENGAVDRLTDWAVFFCEYAAFMPPLQEGPVDFVAGSSAVYERKALEEVGPEVQEEVWEWFMHGRMAELGIGFYSDDRLRVLHKKRFGFWYFMSQRYHYSRSFAGMRMEGAPLWKRLAYAVATPALPPLILWRVVRTVLAKGSRRRELGLSFPLLGVFMLSYAWGEAVGAVVGPGDSLGRVE